MNESEQENNYLQLCKKITQLPCFIDSKVQSNTSGSLCTTENSSNAKPITIKRIEAGQSSLCFDITYQNKRYFVKYDENSVFFENELKVSKAASTINLSPKVIYAEQHWLVNEFIEGDTLDNQPTSIKNKIHTAIGLMQKCHTLRADIPKLEVTDIIVEIVSKPCFTTAQQSYIEKLLQQFPIIPESELLVCHGDINFSNIITTTEKAWLIDFECTCLAEKEFEIAMFFAINLLTDDEQAYALQHYETINTGSKINAKKLKQFLFYSYLINGLWYIEKVKTSLSSKKHPFYQLALEQFNLFDSMYVSESPLSLIMR